MTMIMITSSAPPTSTLYANQSIPETTDQAMPRLQAANTPNEPKTPKDDVFMASIYTEINKHIATESCLQFSHEDYGIKK